MRNGVDHHYTITNSFKLKQRRNMAKGEQNIGDGDGSRLMTLKPRLPSSASAHGQFFDNSLNSRIRTLVILTEQYGREFYAAPPRKLLHAKNARRVFYLSLFNSPQLAPNKSTMSKRMPENQPASQAQLFKSMSILPTFLYKPRLATMSVSLQPANSLSNVHLALSIDHFIAGASALSFSYACMHPLDTLKTRIQADTTSTTAAQRWKVVFSRETFRVLGKGFFISAIGAAGQGGARFSTYEFTKSYLLPDKNTGQKKSPYIPAFGTISATAISALVGDLASSVIKVPREVITAKLQTDHYATSTHRTTAAYVIRTTFAEEGARGFFRGFWTIAARDCPFMVILLTTYENFKAYHHRSVRKDLLEKMHRSNHPHAPAVVAGAALEDLEADIPTLKSILFGGVSGFLAAYFTTPMDVMRTRMITYKRSIVSASTSTVASSSSSSSAASMTEIARHILRSALAKDPSARVGSTIVMDDAVRVYRAFFVGAVPRSLWWFGICSIFFPVYEGMKSVLDGSDTKEP
ncbi:mitochondrial carrier domain-containing protein [Endogone sp. FLAS-F59071]|nr:mitochondrial carrier domain-containing protein [Endogone sp. FLAS-F59071]|eukprot:RUS20095.1 mitochondrial carrier domain-containing protein [Endogone sp. FLAS-F59071]